MKTLVLTLLVALSLSSMVEARESDSRERLELTPIAESIAEGLAPGITEVITVAVLDVDHGWASHKGNFIIIPSFAFDKYDEDYQRYYVAHELAHLLLSETEGHSDKHKAVMKQLAPDVAHYEEWYEQSN